MRWSDTGIAERASLVSKSMPESPVFEKIYRDYLERIAARDWSGKVDLLGVRVDGKTVEIDFFNTPFTITPEAIADPAGKNPLTLLT